MPLLDFFGNPVPDEEPPVLPGLGAIPWDQLAPNLFGTAPQPPRLPRPETLAPGGGARPKPGSESYSLTGGPPALPGAGFQPPPGVTLDIQAAHQGGYGEPGLHDLDPRVAEQIRVAYRTFLGREPSDEEILSQTGNGTFWFGDPRIQLSIANIEQSPEAEAYKKQKTTPPTTTPPGSGWKDPGTLLTWLKATYPHTPAGLAQAFKEHPEMFPPGSSITGSKGDKLRLANGRIIDLILAAGLGGQGWQWLEEGGGSTPPPGGSTPGPAPGFPTVPGIPGLPINPSEGFPIFDDPGTNLLEQLIRGRLSELFQPVNDPGRDVLGRLLTRRISGLEQPLVNPDLDPLLQFGRQRFEFLQQAPFTGAEEEVLKGATIEPIESDRAQTKQRTLQRLADRGIDPRSGIAQKALIEVDTAFDAMRAKEHGEFGRFKIGETQKRQREALQVGDFLRLASQADLERQQEREREQLDVGGSLVDLTGGIRAEEQGRRREALGIAQLLSELPERRLQLALAALNQGQPPESVFRDLLGFAQLQQNQGYLNQRTRQQFFSGLGQLLANMNFGRTGTVPGGVPTGVPPGTSLFPP